MSQRFAIYARVSTNKHRCRVCNKTFAQEGTDEALYCPFCRSIEIEHGQNPETQLIMLRRYVQERGGEVIHEYVDRGWSGAKDRRPALDEMMKDAKEKKFDTVLVSRFDRLGRSTQHLIAVSNTFKQIGINFVSVADNVDTTTAMGKFFYTLMAAIAELERNLIQERVQAGLDRARAKGKKLGRRFSIVDKEKVRRLRTEEGLSLRQIAEKTGISHGTVATILRQTNA